MSEIETVNARLDQMEADVYARLSASTARMDDTMEKLEPITRAAAKQAQIESVEAMGKVVRDKKPARVSGTINASLAGLFSSCYAAYELWPAAVATGEWGPFGAAVGSALSFLVALWRRYKVGDLEVLK